MTDVATFDAPSTAPTGTNATAAAGTAPALRKRSIILAGRKTSITMTDQDWALLKGLAAAHRVEIRELISDIAIARSRYSGKVTLSEAARRFVRKESAKAAKIKASMPAAMPETVS